MPRATFNRTNAEKEDGRITALAGGPIVVPVTTGEISYASGLFLSQAQQRTRVRRANRSSREESSAPVSIGIAVEDLRVGVPSLLEHPCRLSCIKSESLRTLLRASQIVKLLDLCKEQPGFEICDIGCLEESPMSGTDKFSVPTVQLSAHQKPGQEYTEAWIEVARTIYRHVQAQTTETFSVIINDPSFYKRLRLRPCTKDDAIFSQWNNVLAEILRTISLNGIHYFSCCRPGALELSSDFPATVLLGEDGMVPQEWKMIREQIIAILEAFGLESVGLLIWKDQKGLQADEYPNLWTAMFADDTPANLGSSLALHGLPATHPGTLGGWVELQDPETDKWVPYALTCARCVLPADGHGSSQENRNSIFDDWKANGIMSHIKDLSETIRSFEAERVSTEVQGAREKDELMPPDKSAAASKHLSEMFLRRKAKREQLQAYLDSKSNILGVVVAASALESQHKDGFLDWALVSPREDRPLGDNIVSILPKSNSASLTV
ncbi:uncharacterized protein BO97DRAFT_426615 [Aspergillus homomorphus CBS 101889]|uniref:Uncharacterized protein n=1 Tax=Aspergillus homomorphus (strain CBS 101889) TaxID=1450537 RepID=A0A395HQY3_ASPHC|nr:hypothetical protein BO97DRAFT_426615 [Aspergillus homomorphus CBS 101889]RAL10362.1 hypothetical protein BO97DRAFT_426615 [Aspergillus homomorphus CBS 101889]